MRKAVVIYSGGLDSTVLLYALLAERCHVKALGFNYGQKHRKELLSAQKITKDLRVDYQVVDLSPLSVLLRSALTVDGWEVPEGHYQEDTMRQTVVPNRNMIMLSIAAGYCISQGFDGVCYAAHGGDHAIYPDCRPEFVQALDAAVRLCDWSEVRIEAPFLRMTKGEIVKLGNRLGVPFVDTWTCYKGGEYHCGKCASCVERREAFEVAGVKDPTVYMI